MLSSSVILGCLVVFVIAGLLTYQAIKLYTKVDEKLAAQRAIAQHFHEWYEKSTAELTARRTAAVRDLIGKVESLATPPTPPAAPAAAAPAAAPSNT